MGLIFDCNNPYHQTPHHYIKTAKIKEMSGAAMKVYAVLLFEAHQHTKIEMFLTNAELFALTGLDPKSIKSGRELLSDLGLVQWRKGSGGFWYSICGHDGDVLDVPEGLPARRYKGLDLSHCTPEQHAAFYEFYLGSLRSDGFKLNCQVLCPFHPDHTPSMSIDLRIGTFKCHHTDMTGGMVAFEMALNKCDKATAGRNVNRIITGKEPIRDVVEATYAYPDEQGVILYEVLRFAGKRFGVQRLSKGKVVKNIKGVRRVLYNLPAVIASTHAVVTEGEKDAGNVAALKITAPDGTPYSTTCNPFGVGKWLPEFSSFFRGKQVLIMADADDIGIRHAHTVQESIRPYANTALITDWDGSKDVSQYVNTHSREELLYKVETAQLQHPSAYMASIRDEYVEA